MINIDLKEDYGLLEPEDFSANINFPDDRVDYGLSINLKRDLLKIADTRFLLRQELLEDFYRFVEKNKPYYTTMPSWLPSRKSLTDNPGGTGHMSIMSRT